VTGRIALVTVLEQRQQLTDQVGEQAPFVGVEPHADLVAAPGADERHQRHASSSFESVAHRP
jgi:hypothetical protein